MHNKVLLATSLTAPRKRTNVGHKIMRYGITAIFLALLVGCSSRPTPQEVLLRSDGTVTVNGAPVTDRQLRDLAIAKYRKQGSFPLTIRAEANVPVWRLAHTADIFRSAGVWKISTGATDPNSPALLYPTSHTWTNEWKWDGLFDGLDLMATIKTNAGVNVRLLSDGALIESFSATMPELFAHLASIAGGDRARVVITADTNAPHSSLMAVLEACEKHTIDPLFVEHWQAEQGGGYSPPATLSAQPTP